MRYRLTPFLVLISFLLLSQGVRAHVEYMYFKNETPHDVDLVSIPMGFCMHNVRPPRAMVKPQQTLAIKMFYDSSWKCAFRHSSRDFRITAKDSHGKVYKGVFRYYRPWSDPGLWYIIDDKYHMFVKNHPRNLMILRLH